MRTGLRSLDATLKKVGEKAHSRPGAIILASTLALASVASLGLTTASAQAASAPATADRVATWLGEPALGLPSVVEPPPITASDRTTRAVLSFKERKQRRAERIKEFRRDLVRLARKQVGDTYRAGAAGPNAFDCSGLTRYLFRKVTGRKLPHYSKAQYRQVKQIPRSKARPGDLVFYFRHGAHHVGIYVGNGRMIHAVGYGRGVKIGSVSGPWYSRHFSGFGRVLPKA